MKALWKDMDKVKGTTYEKTYLESASNLLEGVYLYRNANDTYNVIRETDKGKPVAGVKDGIGYVTGYEKGSKDLGEAGGIQFEIVPCDMSNKTVGLEYFDHYQDFDYDGLTSLSEWFWSNHTFFHNGKEMRYGNLSSSEWDSDGDMLSDSWEIRYGFDPCSDNSPNKNDDDGDEDGIKDVNEFYLGNPEEKVLERTWRADKKTYRKNIVCRLHDMSLWGAQPDRQDIFVEVDWMELTDYTYYMAPEWGTYVEHTKVYSYKISSATKEKVILAFFKACRYGVNITLHIDDGCMGGGGSLGKHDKRFTSSVESDLKKNNYGTGSNTGFDKSTRKGIFHYCVFAHLDEDGDIEHAGSADGPGYFLVIYDIPFSNQGVEFMHELGHNIIGHYHPGHDDHNPNADHLKDRDGRSDNGREHCLNDCALKRGTDILHHGPRPVNYCSDCWYAIRYDGLDGAFT